MLGKYEAGNPLPNLRPAVFGSTNHSRTTRWLNGDGGEGEELPCDDHVPLNEGAVGKTKKAQKE